MKLIIDSTNKTIELLDQLTFGEIDLELYNLLGEEYLEYKIVPSITYNNYEPEVDKVDDWWIKAFKNYPIYYKSSKY